MIYLLTLILFIVLLIVYLINNRELLAPGFVFCGAFCFSGLWASFYSPKWELALGTNTFVVILGGVLEFVVIAKLTSLLYNRQKVKSIKSGMWSITPIDTWKEILFIILELFTIVITIRDVRVLTGISNIPIAINYYRHITALTTSTIALPVITANLRLAVNAGTCWFAYPFFNEIINKRKINYREGLIIGLGLLNYLVLGSRGGAIIAIIECVAIAGFLKAFRAGTFSSFLHIKDLFKIVLLASIVLFSFQAIGNLIGRHSSTNYIDYIAEYCGAEIKNLDLFLKDKIVNNSLQGTQTFYFLIRWLAPHFGFDVSYLVLDQPHRSINGYPLGNVATTFYSFIYDWGYLGVVIAVLIMAIFSQVVYEVSKCKSNKAVPPQSILIYGVVFYSLLFSFFSNKFFEQIFSPSFVKSVVIWWVYGVFFFKFRLYLRKRVIKKM